MMQGVPAYILAGGRSSRFGSDKALALLGGVPLISRVAGCMSRSLCDVTVVADLANKYQGLGLRTIADLRPSLGPLGGLHTALQDASLRGHDWLFLASSDLITLNPDWIKQLTGHREAAIHFVAFRGDKWEPLVACYHVSLLPLVDEHLRDGKRAMWRLLEAADGVVLPLPPDWPPRVQVNTVAELCAARDELRRE